AFRRDDPQLRDEIEFAPARLCDLRPALPGQCKHAKQGAVRVGHCRRGVPERTPFAIGEYPRSRGLRPDDGFRLEPVARRRFQPIDILVDCPGKQASGQDQQIVRLIRRASILDRLDDCTHIVRRNLGDWTVAPDRNEFALDIALDRTTGALTRYLVDNEVLSDRSECIGALALFRQLGAFLLDGWVDAPGDQLTPVCGLDAGLLERERWITAQGPSRRSAATREAGVQDETDVPCFAGPAWVALIIHAHAEARYDAIAKLIALTGLRRH